MRVDHRRCTLQSALWASVDSRTTMTTGPGVRTLLRFRISASGAFGFGYVTATGWRRPFSSWVFLLLSFLPFVYPFLQGHLDLILVLCFNPISFRLILQSFSHHGRSTSFRAPLGPTLDDPDPGHSGSQPASRCSRSFHSHATQCFTEVFRPAASLFWVRNCLWMVDGFGRAIADHLGMIASMSHAISLPSSALKFEHTVI
jgi:hypothetical protein